MAFFHSCGTASTENSWVKSKAVGLARQSYNLLNNNGGKPYGPAGRFGVSFLAADNTSDSVKATKSNTLLQLTAVPDGMTPLSITPTLAKWLLNMSAIAESEATILLLLSINGPMSNQLVRVFTRCK